MTAAVTHAARPLWRSKIHLQRAIVVASGVLLTLLVFIQVITRYLFSFSIQGVEELATFVAVWFYFLGGAISAERRMHISASLVDLVVGSERMQRVIQILADVISVVICGWMTWWSIGYATWSLKMGMMSLELGFPMGYVHIAIPIGLALMTFYLLMDLWVDIRRLAASEREGAE